MTNATKAALAAVGKGKDSGMCERFTRTCFGFGAKYASAKLAYEASKRDGKITRSYNAPAGVPVFWDITSGTNAPYDHVAVSVGDGYCVSTSAGPNKTVAKVKIKDLTERWGMKYLGWADHYHGKKVYTAPPKKKAAPKAPAVLKRGSKGARVKALQERLNAFKWTPDLRWPKGKIKVDGVYGAITEARVKDVQRRNGLVVDGIAGPVTLKFLGVK